MWVCVHHIVSVENFLKCFSPGSCEAASPLQQALLNYNAVVSAAARHSL